MLNDAEKYRQFEAEDFAADEAFLAWVLSGSQAAEWEMWLAQHTDKQKVIAEAKTLVSVMKSEEQEISNDRINDLWNKIDMATTSTINVSKQARVIPFYQTNFGRASMVVAASIMLLLGFFWWNLSETSYQTGTGEQIAVTLPDGSVATLNAGSTISFNKSTWNENREVVLGGEAFFEVEKGERFTVKTNYGEVAVLGTSFNVQARNKRLLVACYTGKVSVKNDYEVSQVLLPGKKISVEREKILLESFTPENTVAWKRGIFRFDDIPLPYVLEELERQFGIEVKVTTNIKNRKYSGSFSKSDLEEALKMICLPMELSYQIAEDNGMVVINAE